eukprot:TRINITY_DN9617_c0_g1_i1.p1 TRINITY_DN9617_c0_g1~~TRINITY_DN9617_c0_g1_i1.p1  ORF type:complete len:205 (-),score=74.49 TRINITY_DN9617_c0_g1_i1:3-617(-)
MNTLHCISSIRCGLPRQLLLCRTASSSIVRHRYFSTTPPPPSSQQPTPSSSTTSSSPSSPPNVSASSTLQQKPQLGKIATFIKKYGPIGVTTYFGLYGLTLGSVYALVSSGVIMSNDVISLLQTLHVDKLIDLEKVNPAAGHFAVAWILTKFTEPVRAGLTVVIVPPLYRFITGRVERKLHEHEQELQQQQEQQQKDQSPPSQK